jgi:hypothetical protein
MNQDKPTIVQNEHNDMSVIITMPNGDQFTIEAIHSHAYPNTLMVRLNHNNNNMAIFPNVSNEIMIKSCDKHA